MSTNTFLDLPALPAGPAREPSCPRSEAKNSDPFGSVLEKATEMATATAQSEDDSAEAEATTATEARADELPKEEEKDSEKIDPLLVPLVCYCPPPEIKAPEMIAVGGEDISDVPVLDVKADEGKGTEVDTQEMLKPLAEGKSLVEALKQKDFEATKKTDGIALDPKAFEPVAEEATAAELNSKRLQGVADAEKSDGTAAAKLENVARKSEKTAEIAPVIEQKMPVRENLRKVLPEGARVDSLLAGASDSSSREMNFQADAPLDVAPAKAIDMTSVVEKIRTEVTNLRQRGGEAMTVTLRPDGATQLHLEVTVARDGSVHAVARCERGDFQSINAQWPELQQSLAAHGIRMTELSNGNGHGAGAGSQSGAEAFQNFERGQNAPNREGHEGREAFNFEEELAGAPSARSSTRQINPSVAAATSSRRWQSWA
jgi:hypothetical protein